MCQLRAARAPFGALVALLAALLALGLGPAACAQDQDPYPGGPDAGAAVSDGGAGGGASDAGPTVDAPLVDAGAPCDGDAMASADGGPTDGGCAPTDGGVDGGLDAGAGDGGADAGLDAAGDAGPIDSGTTDV